MENLRKVALFLFSFLIADFALASNMTCDLRMYVADESGLVQSSTMPEKITTPILKDARLIFDSPSDSQYTDICSSLDYESKSIFVCAVMSDFFGGYETFLMTPSIVGSPDEIKFPYVLSTVVWGTSSHTSELIYITSDTFLFRDVTEKMAQASIAANEKIKGDTSEVDEAARKAVEMGVIQPGEPIYVDIVDCKIEE